MRVSLQLNFQGRYFIPHPVSSLFSFFLKKFYTSCLFLVTLGLRCCVTAFSSFGEWRAPYSGFSWSTSSKSCGLPELWRVGLVAEKHVESSWMWDWTHISCIGRWIPNHLSTREVPSLFSWWFLLGIGLLLLLFYTTYTVLWNPSFSWVQFSRSVVSDSLRPHESTARQASLSITNSWSLLKLMFIESVMPSSHLILCHPLLLLPPIPPSIRVFSSESALLIRWPKYWSFSFSISPPSEHPGLISSRMDWLNLLVVQGTLKSLLQHHSSKA